MFSLLPFELYSRKSQLYQSLHKRKPLFDLISNKYFFYSDSLTTHFRNAQSSTSQHKFVFVPLFFSPFFSPFRQPQTIAFFPGLLTTLYSGKHSFLSLRTQQAHSIFATTATYIFLSVSPISLRNYKSHIQNSMLLLLSPNDHV